MKTQEEHLEEYQDLGGRELNLERETKTRMTGNKRMKRRKKGRRQNRRDQRTMLPRADTKRKHMVGKTGGTRKGDLPKTKQYRGESMGPYMDTRAVSGVS